MWKDRAMKVSLQNIKISCLKFKIAHVPQNEVRKTSLLLSFILFYIPECMALEYVYFGCAREDSPTIHPSSFRSQFNSLNRLHDLWYYFWLVLSGVLLIHYQRIDVALFEWYGITGRILSFLIGSISEQLWLIKG